MLKEYKLPEIRTEDCEQKYIQGWGPGGQAVNKKQNAAQVIHKPTGIVVKVHESRLLQDNIKLAFERLKLAVDRHLNGDNCYEEEFKRLERKYEQRAKKSREKRRKLKEASEEEPSV
ncbi:RF-PROK-I domain-containing protein [Aphelenchoides bicaudatus]|nr:RF-PROK-I domain-containing protein [Aphelenchoides bicaudatus]